MRRIEIYDGRCDCYEDDKLVTTFFAQWFGTMWHFESEHLYIVHPTFSFHLREQE